jgi:uncharacterized membrane protein
LKVSKAQIRLDNVIIFNDVIFAFSITLVILSIIRPQLPNNLDEVQIQLELWEMLPYCESYGISFGLIDIFSLEFAYFLPINS